jgi:DNA-binding XRE family transcriptional regulator
MRARVTKEQFIAMRGKLGWSQSDLARALGVTLRTIQRAEGGTGKLGVSGPLAFSMMCLVQGFRPKGIKYPKPKEITDGR